MSWNLNGHKIAVVASALVYRFSISNSSWFKIVVTWFLPLSYSCSVSKNNKNRWPCLMLTSILDVETNCWEELDSVCLDIRLNVMYSCMSLLVSVMLPLCVFASFTVMLPLYVFACITVMLPLYVFACITVMLCYPWLSLLVSRWCSKSLSSEQRFHLSFCSWLSRFSMSRLHYLKSIYWIVLSRIMT